MGHVRMMAAVQPFISGAISKTVNMSSDATVEEIGEVYVQGWRLGLKAIAVYRDGCKRTQPLNTAASKTDDAVKGHRGSAASPAQAAAAQAAAPRRRKLPDERQALTHKFSVAGHEGYVTVGLYDDGTPGEIFLTMAKEGSTISGLMDAFATAISLTLQYGVPLEALVEKFSHMRFEPAGYTKNQEIPIAKSLVDYIFRWLASRFLTADLKERIGVVSREARDGEAPSGQPKAEVGTGAVASAQGGGARPIGFALPMATVGATLISFQNSADAPSCHDCGSLMVRNGACYKCLNCGSTSGCS
jgi:ribonucleoside-diphosphate reductase alpha chain